MEGEGVFLRFLRNGKETENFTLPFDGEATFALGLRGNAAHAVRFYLGNDERVLLREDAPFLRMEGAYCLYAVTLRGETIAPNGSGLFFFHFEADLPEGRRYTAFDGEKLSLAPQFAGELQLTVYRPRYLSPDWLDRGVFYQIFVDRFCRSGRAERRADAVYCDDWENGVPEYPPVAGQEYPNNTHFGGDLYGVAEQLPYLRELGVTVLYLSPVAAAFSNHKYDTGDYLQVDPSFGGEDALQALFDQAHALGMRVLLDGVFNHVGDDSRYFNRYGKYPSAGACQSKESPYYPWFRFTSYPDAYECWWGIKNLPRTVKCESFRAFICEEVVPKYLRMGADGFRLDVADELDSTFLEEIVAAVKREKPDAAVIGEVWEDASNKISYGERRQYFHGTQLDGVMNYPFRNGLLAFLREGDASLLREVTSTICRHYPPKALAHTMNSIGTHDTPRILTLLGGEDGDGFSNDELAVRRMEPEQRARAIRLLQCGYPLLAALPGVPCIYYGDEAGMEGYGDPFNRRPFPWHAPEPVLFEAFRAANRVRASESLFAAEGFALLDSPPATFAFRRFDEQNGLIVVSNRSNDAIPWRFDGEVTELLTGRTFSGETTVPPFTTCYFKEEP